MDGVALAFFVAGSLLILLAGVGVVRFPDTMARLHAAAKAPILGLMLTGTGVLLALGRWEATTVVVLVIVLQIVASPVGTHVLARSVYYRLRPDLDGPDQLADALEQQHADD